MTSIASATEPHQTSKQHQSGMVTRVVRAAARGSQRYPKTIIGLWLLMVVAVIGLGSLVGTRALATSESGVGESAQADALIHEASLAPQAVENILIRSSSGSDTAAVVGDMREQLAGVVDVASVRGPAEAPALSIDDGRTVLLQAALAGDPDQAADHVAPVEKVVQSVQRNHPDVDIAQAGAGSIAHAIQDLVSSSLTRAMTISLPITLIILVLAFGALVAASVPLLLGLTSIAAGMGALALVSHVIAESESTSAVASLIGLAVAVDYSLFYVRREREERRLGRPATRRYRHGRLVNADDGAGTRSRTDSVIDAAAASVGRAILMSGIIVIVALIGLMITGQPDFLSMGAGTIVAVAIAVVGSLTVLPAVLALLGDRLDRGTVPGSRRLRARRQRKEALHGHPVGFWAWLASGVTAKPLVSLVVAVGILAAPAALMFKMHTGQSDLAALPADLPVVQAVTAINDDFPGAPAEAELVVQGTDLSSRQATGGLQALGDRAVAVTGGAGNVTVAVSRDGSVARIDVPMPARGSDAQADVIRQLRDTVADTATDIDGVEKAALVTGEAAQNVDFSDRMASGTPVVIAFVLVLGFVLLLVTFRSALLAASMMLLNLVSVGATYGIVVLVFQHTWAESLLGFESTGAIIDWIPLFLFVILFGLSMDYTMLILERIREYRREGLSPREAASRGVAATAGTVTSAAVVMVGVFAIFARLDMLQLKQLGVGLAVAVLLDATIVRGIALPAVAALLGRKGWKVKSLARASD